MLNICGQEGMDHLCLVP